MINLRSKSPFLFDLQSFLYRSARQIQLTEEILILLPPVFSTFYAAGLAEHAIVREKNANNLAVLYGEAKN